MVDSRARELTRKYSTVAAVTSFVSQPIPGADELFVITTQYALSASLARQHGVKMRALPWAKVNRIVWGGAAVRLIAGFTVGLIPVAGALANAMTAFASTELLGRYLETALENAGRE